MSRLDFKVLALGEHPQLRLHRAFALLLWLGGDTLTTAAFLWTHTGREANCLYQAINSAPFQGILLVLLFKAASFLACEWLVQLLKHTDEERKQAAAFCYGMIAGLSLLLTISAVSLLATKHAIVQSSAATPNLNC